MIKNNGIYYLGEFSKAARLGNIPMLVSLDCRFEKAKDDKKQPKKAPKVAI